MNKRKETLRLEGRGQSINEPWGAALDSDFSYFKYNVEYVFLLSILNQVTSTKNKLFRFFQGYNKTILLQS